MDNKDSSLPDGASQSGQGFVAGLALVALIVLMIVSYFYPYPDGRRPDLLSLLMFWGREALYVVLAFVALALFAIASIIRAVRGHRRGKPSA